MKEPPPCRLSVILARAAPVGVIFRRGPTNRVQLIRWNTDNDSFEHGQWFHGVMEADRSDLSPSGNRLIYFAKGHKRRGVAEGYADTWTAVSRPPYWTALALWPLGNTWFGGGLFADEGTVLLSHPGCAAEHHPKHPPKGLEVISAPRTFFQGGLLAERCRRDGWVLREEIRGRGMAGTYPEEWERAIPKSQYSLLLLDQHSSRWDQRPAHYAVVRAKTREELILFEADWADLDGKGRLVCAREGKMWRVRLPTRGRSVDFREIADFNGARPYRMAAPEWATRW